MESPVLFAEKQRFTQWWIWAILIAVNLLFIYGVVQQIVLGKRFGDTPMDNLAILLISGAMITLTAMMLSTNLVTEITKEGINVRLFPFHWRAKHFSWDDIEKAYVRKYSPLAEYGGWGLRYSITGYGKAYNISGKMGLQLELKTGKKLLIGTKKPEELTAVLEQVK
jgi:hypothetical protein